MSRFVRIRPYVTKTVPLFVGFGLGWAAYDFATQNNYDQMLLSYVPQQFRPAPEIAEAVNKLSFSDVLKQCRLPEQLDWLEENILEEIPFIYLEELLATWSHIHSSTVTGEKKIEYLAPTLTIGIWKKAKDGTVSFSIASQVLRILVGNCEDNAHALLHEFGTQFAVDFVEAASKSSETAAAAEVLRSIRSVNLPRSWRTMYRQRSALSQCAVEEVCKKFLQENGLI